MKERPAVGMFGQKVSLGQGNGPDVDLLVTGTQLYAHYETPDGFTALYDDDLGLFCYARLVDGRFESTGVSVAAPPPDGVERHLTESDEVRMHKIQERTAQLDRRARAPEEAG